MLAYSFLERYPDSGFEAKWIRPAAGYTGNHIVVVRDECVFDYHGFSDWSRYWTHTAHRANQWWPGWSADVVNIHMAALVSRRCAREYEGLWMKEQGLQTWNMWSTPIAGFGRVSGQSLTWLTIATLAVLALWKALA